MFEWLLFSGPLLKNKRPQKRPLFRVAFFDVWLREPDLNRRPSGYEPDELPDCSIPRLCGGILQANAGVSTVKRSRGQINGQSVANPAKCAKSKGNCPTSCNVHCADAD